jgi:microcystin-dependent protein
MATPFVAEIRIFACNFAPRGWAFCNGQLMPISQNTALFSLLGTFYGGDGKSTFALPDLEGSVPIQQGQGPGLSDYVLGEQLCSETVTLIQTEMPAHGHSVNVTTSNGTVTAASGNQMGKGLTGGIQNPTNAKYYSTAAPNSFFNPMTALSIAGSSFPHNNLMPYLVLNFCIALQGIFPARP